MDGQIECVVQDQYLFDEREKANCKDISNDGNVLPETMIGNVRTRFEANKNLQETISMTDMSENQDKQE